MAQAWDAYRTALRAGLRDHHSDTLVFAVRAFAKGTRATYLCAVRGTLQGTNSDDGVQLAIDGRLLLLGHRRRGGSVARNTVSGFQMLAKLQLIPKVVTARMWLQVRAIDKSTAHMARPRIWAIGKDLERLGKCRHHWAWARTFFAVACAAVFAVFVLPGTALPPHDSLRSRTKKSTLNGSLCRSAHTAASLGHGCGGDPALYWGAASGRP